MDTTLLSARSIALLKTWTLVSALFCDTPCAKMTCLFFLSCYLLKWNYPKHLNIATISWWISPISISILFLIPNKFHSNLVCHIFNGIFSIPSINWMLHALWLNWNAIKFFRFYQIQYDVPGCVYQLIGGSPDSNTWVYVYVYVSWIFFVVLTLLMYEYDYMD